MTKDYINQIIKSQGIQKGYDTVRTEIYNKLNSGSIDYNEGVELFEYINAKYDELVGR